MSAGCSKLQNVGLARCDHFSDGGLRAWRAGCPNLQQPLGSPRGYHSLSVACPSCSANSLWPLTVDCVFAEFECGRKLLPGSDRRSTNVNCWMPAVMQRLSFGGKVVYTKVSARVWPPLGAIPASSGISPIGGQSPCESLVCNTFPPKPFHDPRWFCK